MTLAEITAEQVTTVLALASIAGVALTSGYFRAALSTLKDSNAELRLEVEDLERRATSDRAACEAELGELRTKIGELEAQRKVLSTEWAREIAGAIADEWATRRDSTNARLDHLEQYHLDHDAGYRPDIARRKAHREGGNP